jgi:hypothetical protein
MSSILLMKTVVGEGENALVLEPRGESLRIKARGRPDIYVRYDVLPDLVNALAGIALNVQKARA